MIDEPKPPQEPEAAGSACSAGLGATEDTDLCLNCGSRHPKKLWGADCNCGQPNVVHLHPCSGCGAVCGQIIDDDYCYPEKLYCPACVAKAGNA